MAISQALLPEFDHEMSNTRKTLERIPENDLAWKPHPKSMTLGRLAGHVAEMPGWAVPTIAQDSLDIAPAGTPRPQGTVAQSRQHVLELFDKNVKDARAAIAAASDEQLMKPWSLLVGGKTIFTMPKIAVLRSMVMNHTIHHRAQLGVYLRLNNIPVPSIYGPSADEGQM
ncbi:MAG TPA: DinB family protein [Bryobacteraceae bacterium]|nr:DinB family protein [Bryobacteraceae bacterium]